MTHGKVACTLLAVLAMVSTGLSAPATRPAKPKKRPSAGQKKPPAKAQAAKKPPRAGIGHLRLGGAVLASPPEFSLFAGQSTAATLRQWLQRLAKARNDPRLRAVAIEIDAPRMSWAQAQELADAVGRLNQVKPVYAHLTSTSALGYLVASAGRDVSMDPAGTLSITGLAAELSFFKGTLDWVGVEAQMVQIGRFKGAAEPYTRTGPSPELQGEYNKLLDDLYEQLSGQIARQRRLTVPHVLHVIDSGPLAADDARRGRLVDRLVSKADWRESVEKAVGGPKHAPVDWLGDYGKKRTKPLDLSNPWALMGMMLSGRPAEKVREPTIAVIHAHGVIVSGTSGEGLLGTRRVGARTLVKCFRQVAGDDKIKAVVFRVNSPGGSAIASELIYQAVRKCARKKPVIVSISAMGASGGYYIALGGRKLLADPAATVGSVGVISGKLAMTALMEKVGITTHAITRGRNAGLRLSRPWDDREREIIRRLSTRTYETFVSRVREARGKRIKDLDAVTQGRIFTARQAVANGMIDGIGGFREALAAAQSAAKIQRSYILTLPRPKTLLDVLYGDQQLLAPPGGAVERLLAGKGMPAVLSEPRRQMLGYLLSLAQLFESEVALTAMPHGLSIRP